VVVAAAAAAVVVVLVVVRQRPFSRHFKYRKDQLPS